MSARPLQKLQIGELESLIDDQASQSSIKKVLKELQERTAKKRNLALIEKIQALLTNTKPSRQPVVQSTPQPAPPVPQHNPETPAPRADQPSDGNQVLPQYLGEFIIALQKEIEAAQRNSASSAYLLTEGKLIAPVGSSYHYRFQSQRRLRVPPDTEGDYQPGNGAPMIKVTVIEIHDLEVTLDIPERLPHPGLQGKLMTDLSKLLEKLIERIRTKGTDPQPPASRILGFSPVSGSRMDFNPINKRLNTEQQDAVASVLGMDTVFLWGPPGTGKTQTIGEIGAQLYQKGSTLLLVSHTNTAVDEALVRIAEGVDGKFEEGEILRLGEPVKAELLARPDLILKRVAEKRSAELEMRKSQLDVERLRTLAELQVIHRRVDLLQWLEEGGKDVLSLQHDWQNINELETAHASASHDLATLTAQLAPLKQVADVARTAQEAERRLVDLQSQLVTAKTQIDGALTHKKAADLCLATAQKQLRQAEEIEPQRLKLKLLPSEASLHQRLSQLTQELESFQTQQSAQHSRLMRTKELLARTLSVGAIKRLWQKLPSPEEQGALAIAEEHVLAGIIDHITSLVERQEETKQTLNQITALQAELGIYAHIPPLISASNAYEAAKRDAQRITSNHCVVQHLVDALVQEEQSLTLTLAEFTQHHGSSPSSLLHHLAGQLTQEDIVGQKLQSLKTQLNREQRALKEKVLGLCHVLQEWNLLPDTDLVNPTLSALIKLILKAQTKARQEVGEDDLTTITTQRNQLSATVASLIDEIREVEEKLKTVEESLLANVRILATTLTRAYMRNGIQSRVFNTVLVDEASMAPIPALWASATLADRCVVAVGDFKQLPPIVISDDEIALRWLGRDVFNSSGVQGAYERHEPPAHFVALREQHRMHPQISAIVNELVYNGLLRNGNSVTESKADDSIRTWYSAELDAASRVTLLDMSAATAWNTSADKSRFNLLNAMTIVELTRTWLKPDRPSLPEGGSKRVLMISPYRPHSKLLDIMVRTDGLDDEIMANTVHSFQGSEADAVIIDLVVDDPHRSANLLTPTINESIMRLLNVAVTRARRRLFIVGNFDWLRQKGSGAFVGGQLLPWLTAQHRQYNMINVMSTRVDGHRILAAEHTYQTFLKSLPEARSQVIIFSPHLSQEPVQLLLSALQPLLARGVQVALVTQLPVGQNRSQQEPLYTALRESKIILIFKHKMAEKLMLLDQQEVWAGTFSLLDNTPTKGYYLRRKDKKFAAELSDMFSLPEILDAYTPLHLCPICNAQMSIADAAGEGKPYYWRCSQAKCYTRSFGSPAPVDGLLLPKCGSQPTFGYRDQEPYWFCTCDQRNGHRIKMQARHLMLSKMVALIPERSRAKVYRYFRLPPPS